MEENEIKDLIKQLSYGKVNVRLDASETLGCAAANEKTKELVLNLLIEKLFDGDKDVRWYAIGALTKAAEKGVNISAAVPKLAELVSDKNNDVRAITTWILSYVIKNRADASIALPALGKALGDVDLAVRRAAKGILEKAAENCKTKEELLRLVKEIKGSLEAKEFAMEIYREWMKEQNERIRIRIDKKMRRPERKPNGKRLRKLVN